MNKNTRAELTCERSILLAADHISKLRDVDVMRVVEDYLRATGKTDGIVAFIAEHRPELASEAKQCAIELKEPPCRREEDSEKAKVWL